MCLFKKTSKYYYDLWLEPEKTFIFSAKIWDCRTSYRIRHVFKLFLYWIWRLVGKGLQQLKSLNFVQLPYSTSICDVLIVSCQNLYICKTKTSKCISFVFKTSCMKTYSIWWWNKPVLGNWPFPSVEGSIWKCNFIPTLADTFPQLMIYKALNLSRRSGFINYQLINCLHVMPWMNNTTGKVSTAE